jgi:uncharacterized membrane protein
MWLDEAYSAITARKTLAGIGAALAHDAGPPLYYVLLHLWRAVWGESELALRSLSVLFALGTTLLVYRLAASHLGRGNARIAASLWAVHPLAIFYAGEARNYTLFAFLFLVLVSALCDPTARSWWKPWVAGASAIALIYTHNLGWFAVAAAALATGLVYRQGILNRRFLLALVAVLSSYLPWIPILQQQLQNSQKTIGWMSLFWAPWAPLLSVGAFTPLGRGLAFSDLPAAPEGWWPWLGLLWVSPAVAALVVWRTKQAAAHVRYLWLALLLGLALPTVYSAMKSPLTLPGRTDFFLLPLFLILAGAGIARARPWLRYGATSVLAIWAAGASLMYQGHVSRSDERAWVDVLQTQTGPGDIVICTYLTRPAAEYYLSNRGLLFLSYPTEMAQELAHYSDAWNATHLNMDADAESVVSEAMSKLQPGHRLWVVSSRPRMEGPLLVRLIQRVELTQEPVMTSTRMGLRSMRTQIALLPFHRKDGSAHE